METSLESYNYESKLKVKHLMSTNLITLNEEDSLKTLEEVMDWRKIRHVPIINNNEDLVGLVSHRDYLAVAVSELAEIDDDDKLALYRSVPIKQIMKKVVKSVNENVSIEVAAKIMAEEKLGCLFVINDDELVGIITEADFVKAFYKV